MPRSRSLTRLTIRVGLLHLGQSVDFVVSITFWRSPVFAIFAMGGWFSSWDCLCTHAPDGGGFNGADWSLLLCLQNRTRKERSMSGTRSFQFTSHRFRLPRPNLAVIIRSAPQL